MKRMKIISILAAVGFFLTYSQLYAGETSMIPKKMHSNDGDSKYDTGHGMMEEYQGLMGHDKDHFKRYGDKMSQSRHYMFGRGFVNSELIAILGLDEEQVEKIKEIESNYMKTFIRSEADLKIAEIELEELLSAKQVILEKVKEKTSLIGLIHSELRFFRFKTIEDIKDLLRDDQKEQFRKLISKYMSSYPFHN